MLALVRRFSGLVVPMMTLEAMRFVGWFVSPAASASLRAVVKGW